MSTPNNFPPAIEPAVTGPYRSMPDPGEPYIEPRPYNPDLWLYREKTVALLKRYLRMSVEVGRLPSLLGREFFRSKITHYRVGTFEDAVIFVHDMDRSLEQLNDLDQRVIAAVVFQERTHDDASGVVGCWRRTIGRRFPEALDRLTEIFLDGGILTRLPKTGSTLQKSCQEARNDEFFVSDSEDSK
jgi:hypothetical protein